MRRDAGFALCRFSNQALQTFDANPVDTLVIDYRGNGGGDSSIINPLLNGLDQRLSQSWRTPRSAATRSSTKGRSHLPVDDAMAIRTRQIEAAAQLPGVGLENITAAKRVDCQRWFAGVG